MGWIKRLFGGDRTPQDDGLYLFIKCNRCNTPVKVRINLANDLAADYGDTAAEGYTLRKEIMDDRCFRVMHAELSFDARRRERSRTIEGGTFITAEEYATLRGE